MNAAENLLTILSGKGFTALGGFALTSSEQEIFGLPGPPNAILIGNHGPAMWEAFREDGGEDDGPDPLDRWTRGVIEPRVEDAGLRCLFPFDGPPWPPFGQWAIRTRQMFDSPLGLKIHGREGIWIAFRAVIAGFDSPLMPVAEPTISPCTGCSAPCLTACPVRAFRADGYDVAGCRSHVDGAGDDCRNGGCLSRHACPVNPGSAWSPAQARFHMQAFLDGLPA